jgi:N-acetylmuramoyl-L-alanine amidase
MIAAATRAFLVALTFVGATVLLAPARTTPVRPPTSNLRIGGVEYVDAINFGVTLGLKFEPTTSPRKFLLRGPAGTVTLEVDSRECAIGRQRVFLGEPVRDYRGRVCFSRVDAERLFAPILRPGLAQIAKPRVRVIALDPGHGGKDPGKGNPRLKINEKALALDTALRLAALLKKQGYKVVMTRAGDKFIDLPDRPEIARRLGADLFISLHFNAAAVPSARGVEVFTLTPQSQYSTADTTRDDDASAAAATAGNANDPWNALLGYHLHRELVQGLKVPDRGLKRARWAVLRPAPCPAVLVESGYLSNDAEARLIATPAYRQQIAAAIAKGVAAYASALNATPKAAVN